MMKKIFTAVGALMLIGLFCGWVYLLVFGSPIGAGDSFFGGLTNPTPFEELPTGEITAQLALSGTKISQLTTRSVAGYGFVLKQAAATSSTPTYALRYAENGTGHVYEIDLVSGIETRLSGITVGKTVSASFDPEGKAFALSSERSNRLETQLYVMENVPTENTTLPLGSGHLAFMGENRLRYTDVENDKTIAYELDWDTGLTKTLWEIPFAQVNVYWTSEDALVVNKVSPTLRGGVYRVTEEGLVRVIPPQISLTAILSADEQTLWYSHYYAGNEENIAFKHNLSSGSTDMTTLPAVPEKCFMFSNGTNMCAISSLLLSSSRDDLNRWYRGEMTSNDQLWREVDGVATHEADLSELTGMNIDANEVRLAPDQQSFFFVNKTTRTLWWYRFED